MMPRWFFTSFLVVLLITVSSCRWCEITGSCRDVIEVSTTGGLYVFELDHVRFDYDPNGGQMVVTNLTSIHASGRITRWDDAGDDRNGMAFDLPNYLSEKSYHEHYPRGTELKILIKRDGLQSESYVQLQ